jgi:hypothetical protein
MSVPPISLPTTSVRNPQDTTGIFHIQATPMLMQADIVKGTERSVWVLARPTSLASILSPLSQGKYPVCHWGLLASEYRDLKELWANRGEVTTLNNASWGTLFELFRTPDNKNIPRIISNFGPERIFAEWSFSSIVYIGQTSKTDEELSAEGLSFFQS